MYHNDFQVIMANYSKTMHAGGQAFYLMEPYLRGLLCFDIADKVRGDSAKQKELKDWCLWQGARTARYTMHEFRGEAIDSKVDGTYNGTLKPGDILPDDGFVLVVPGMPRDTEIHAMRVEHNLLQLIKADNRYHAEAMKLDAENQKWMTKRKAEVAALQKKQAGKGNKVVFGERFFSDLDPVPAASKIESCEHVYWQAFATPKFKKNAMFVWEMSVDGQACKQDYFQDDWNVAGGPFFDSFNGGGCSDVTQVPGKHTLTVQLWSMKGVKTGGKLLDVSGDHAVLIDQIADRKDKVVAKGSLSCDSPEGLTLDN
jgi:hypothetical protein